MKVCIIGPTERNYLPYMERYVDFFTENKIEFDIICWQREEPKVAAKENEYNFIEPVKEGVTNKILSYLRFKKFILNRLKATHYDKIVMLTTVPCVFLKGYLQKHYKGNYLFDIRDYSFERFGFYKKAVDKLIDNSALTTISSKGFMDFLSDNEKIVMNHNLNFHDNVETTKDLKNQQMVNIGFVGGVRYYDENIALIDKLKNTFRYQLWYIGQPIKTCDIEGYCKEQGITNVSFIGKYANSQKPELYKNIDIINSIYGDDSLEVTTALPNRLYEACLYKKPIISSKGTYLGEVIDQYGLGVVVDAFKDDVQEKLDTYLDNFAPDVFLKGCENFLNDVIKDEQFLYAKLNEFIAK